MTMKSPKSALKALVACFFILSIITVSCNDEKKTETEKTETVTPAPTTTDTTTIDTTGKNPMDTGTTKPVKELN